MPGSVYMEVLEIARAQRGFVRPADLRSAGIDPKRLVDYQRRGLAEKRAHGLYRINLVSPEPGDDLMEAALWPDGRGIISHESALDLWNVCDVNPTQIDITVSGPYRTHREIPELYRLHHQNLRPEQVTRLDNLPVVKVETAIFQMIESGRIRQGLIAQAIDRARSVGLISSDRAAVLYGAA